MASIVFEKINIYALTRAQILHKESFAFINGQKHIQNSAIVLQNVNPNLYLDIDKKRNRRHSKSQTIQACTTTSKYSPKMFI